MPSDTDRPSREVDLLDAMAAVLLPEAHEALLLAWLEEDLA